MFGNKPGWIFAAMLLGLEIWVVWFIVNLDSIQKPSTGVIPKAKLTLNITQRPELLQEIQLPFQPSAIYSGMTKSEDAGPLYREAIEKYLTNLDVYEKAYDKQAKQFRSMNYKDYPGLEQLVKARECASMNLFQSRPDVAINYKNFQETFDPPYMLGKFANGLAFRLSADADKKDQAKLLAESVFSLGIKMMQERLRYAEFDNGQRIAREAALILGRIDPSKMDAVKKMDEGLRDMIRGSLNPMAHIIMSVDQEVIGPTGGDVFYIAKNAKERMWRIEAVLKLGRYKFDVGIPGHGPNQKWARIWVRKMSNDTREDPMVRSAATAAHKLDAEGYAGIGT